MAANGPVAPALAELVRPHIDSFNWFITDGIKRVVDLLEPVEVRPLLINRFAVESQVLVYDCRPFRQYFMVTCIWMSLSGAVEVQRVGDSRTP